MVDAAQFRKINPNYARPSIIKVANSRRCGSNPIDLSNWFDDDDGPRGPPPSPRADPVKIDDVDVDMQDEDNLIICSPTVLGYSLNDKLWCKNPVW